MRRDARRLAVLMLLGAFCVPARAVMQEVVVGSPGKYGQTENGFPFATLPGAYGYASTRYQQVYDAGAFGGPLAIRQIVFFPSSNTDAAILAGSIEIYLSATSLGVNEISGRSFDANLGSDARRFAEFEGGFALTGPEFVISGDPFLFDPRLGNLLLDIRVNGAPAGHSGPFFAALGPDSFPHDVKAPFSRWHDFGGGFDNRGLVTAFRANVPEPGTLALLAGGLLGFGLASRRKEAAS
jgi:hypothetical protein